MWKRYIPGMSETTEAKAKAAKGKRRRFARGVRPDHIEPTSGNLVQHLYRLYDLVHVDARRGALDGDDLRRLGFVDRFESEDELAPARGQHEGITD
jgi:hypothetical protein